tara:strand:- start:53469 stop:53915 length:447 start_codon:yes stop_codon:yes gene_type:complete
MNHLINQEKNNPELQNTLDIQTILESAENVDNNYIGDHSLKTISKEVYDTIKEQNIETDIVYKYCTSLLHYRLIDHVYHIHKGKHIRWLRDKKLTNGGIVVDIKFLDNGTHILCKNKNRFIQYKFDDCPTFQKLTHDELLILQIKDNV